MGGREAWMDHGEAVEVRVAELEALLLTARSNSAGWRSRYEEAEARIVELEKHLALVAYKANSRRQYEVERLALAPLRQVETKGNHAD